MTVEKAAAIIRDTTTVQYRCISCRYLHGEGGGEGMGSIFICNLLQHILIKTDKCTIFSLFIFFLLLHTLDLRMYILLNCRLWTSREQLNIEYVAEKGTVRHLCPDTTSSAVEL